MSKVVIGSQKLITLHDANNDMLIGVYDVTNAEGEIMDYYHYYFGDYKNYISFLLKRGAVIHDEENAETYLQTHNKIVSIYEIPRIKIGLNVNMNLKGSNNNNNLDTNK